MVCSRCFILFSFLFQCNTPSSLTSPSLLPIATGRRNTSVSERFVRKFYFVFIVILMQCALDPHQFPSSSSSAAIPRRNTPLGAGGGGGGGRVGGVRPRCRPAARGGGGGHERVPVRRGGRGEGGGGRVTRAGDRRQPGGAGPGLRLGGEQRPAAQGACDAREAGEDCVRPAIDDSPPSLSPYLSIPLRTRPR